MFDCSFSGAYKQFNSDLHEDSVGGQLVEGRARGHHVVDSLERVDL